MINARFEKLSNTLRLVGIFVAFGAMVGGVIFFAFFSKPGATSTEVATNDTCIPLFGTVSDKTVILRVDDIQAYSWRETSERMIADAGAREIPLTLGVVPLGLHDDKALSTFLKTHSCRHELALHGLTHSGGEYGNYPEFGAYTKDEARKHVMLGLEVLRGITQDAIVTWIPPFNVHSQGTVEALHELGFQYLSSEGKGQFDYDTSTFSFDTDSLVVPEKIVEACKVGFETSSYCIIMLHPQDFADGLAHSEEKYQEYYINLLDILQNEGFTFARMNELSL